MNSHHYFKFAPVMGQLAEEFARLHSSDWRLDFEIVVYPGGPVLVATLSATDYRPVSTFPRSEVTRLTSYCWEISGADMSDHADAAPHMTMWDDGNTHRRLEDSTSIVTAIMAEIRAITNPRPLEGFANFLAAVKAAGGSSDVTFLEVVPMGEDPQKGFMTRYGRGAAAEGKRATISARIRGGVINSSSIDLTAETVGEVYRLLREAGCQTND